jgi:hypothetical protein
MSTFTLGTSRLGTVSMGTAGSTTDIVGQFREIEIHLSQGTAGGDMLPRFLEVHLTMNGVSSEAIS